MIYYNQEHIGGVKMKKLVVWAIVLILCFSISGCGNNSSEDVNSIMRTNDYKEDVIKFDDIEWLTELSKAEKKVKKDLLTTNDCYRAEEIQNSELDIKSLFIGNDYKVEEPNRKSVGKIAGWDIMLIEMKYVGYKSNNYVYGYELHIKDYEKSTDLELIEKDLVDKLDNKYGEDKRYTNDGYFDYEWRDKNENKVGLHLTTNYIIMSYKCTNIEEYFDKVEEEQLIRDQLEEEKRNKEIKENSSGL